MAERIVSAYSGPFEPAFRRGRNSEIEHPRKKVDLLNKLIDLARIHPGEMREVDLLCNWIDCARIYPGEMAEVESLIEGVLDEYDLMTVKQRKYLKEAGDLIEKLMRRDNLGCSIIRNIKALLTQIWLNGIPECWSTAVVNRLFPTDMEFIGAAADSAKDLMNNVLLGGELRRSADANLCMVEIRKTTLAAWMYNSYAVVGHFEIRVWITTTNGCISADEILRLTARQVHKFQWLFGRSIEDLAESVMKSLRGKRYLIVFDSVPTEKLWEVVKAALPDDGVGSRVIVTTCNAAVGDSSEFAQVHRVERLTFDESWKLFCRTAFRLNPEGRCPEELKPASVKIVRICRGFPLIIKVVAGLLSMKPKVAEEWGSLLCNLEKRLLLLHLDVHEVISLVFDDLPLHLKRCIVYFHVFTEQPAMIRSEKLIRLWIMEGLVQKTQEKTSEEVAQEYLQELVGRRLVEACKGFCRSHDVIHRVVQMKATNPDYWMPIDGMSLRPEFRSSFQWENINQSFSRSYQYSFFSDDIED